MNKKNTINSILKKMTETMPIINNKDIVETIKSQYPDCTISRKERNIFLNGVEMTAPLCASKDTKIMLLKDKSPLLEIYKDLDRGDILVVKEDGDNKIIVENISIKEEYRKSFEIEKLDVVKGNFNVIKRKSIELAKSLEKLGLI